MSNFQAFIVSSKASVFDAMSVIDKNEVKIAFVCNDDILCAAITDGDIRRYILSGKSLNASVLEASNHDFKYAKASHTDEQRKAIMHDNFINALPILDELGKLIDIFWIETDHLSIKKTSLALPVVIMAGGLGVRLHPHTKVLPKPLVPIGDSTITEHIMHRFLQFECSNFFITVNHKKNMIKAYFADEELTYNIKFVEEEKPLGTGGGLSLLKGEINQTFFMTNCDILVFEDYYEILKQHQSSGNLVTMVCSAKNIIIPYGIVDIDKNGHISSLTEKPSYSFLANTGFYVIEPEFLEFVPDNTFVHITDIFETVIAQGKKVGIYPISEEKWADMGQLDEMEKMISKLM
jgi:dTDP-glucose pyrophosphorylase